MEENNLSIDALLEQGNNLLHGYGDFFQDIETGIKFLEKAGQLGSAKAYFILGREYLDGLFSENYAIALNYFTRGSFLDGIESNHCNAEMATIYSNDYAFMDENLRDFQLGKKYWEHYFNNLQKGIYSPQDIIYINEYIRLNRTEWHRANLNLDKENYVEILKLINWFKYILYIPQYDEYDNWENENNVDKFKNIYFKTLNKFITQNFNLSNKPQNFEFYRNLDEATVIEINDSEIILNVIPSKQQLKIDDVVCISASNSEGLDFYARVKEIKIDSDFVKKTLPKIENTIIFELIIGSHNDVIKCIDEKNNKIDYFITGEFYYNPPMINSNTIKQDTTSQDFSSKELDLNHTIEFNNTNTQSFLSKIKKIFNK